jgi:hypothetical protein
MEGSTKLRELLRPEWWRGVLPWLWRLVIQIKIGAARARPCIFSTCMLLGNNLDSGTAVTKNIWVGAFVRLIS